MQNRNYATKTHHLHHRLADSETRITVLFPFAETGREEKDSAPALL
jgi:hypothetical protein